MYRILLVDDDKVILEAMKRDLESDFLIVEVASSGTEALDILAYHKVDVVITDISMPRMNGLELIAEIRTLYPSIKVIVLSHYDDFILIKEAMRLGAVDYLRKNEANRNVLLSILNNLPEFESTQYQIGVNKAKNIEMSQLWLNALQGKLSATEKLTLLDGCSSESYIPIVLQFRNTVSPMLIKRFPPLFEEVRIQDWIHLDERTWLQFVSIDASSQQTHRNLWAQTLICLVSQLNEWKEFSQYFAIYHDDLLSGKQLIASLAQIGERLDCVFYEGYDRIVSVKNCMPITKSIGTFFLDWSHHLVESSKAEPEHLIKLASRYLDEIEARRFSPDAVRHGCYGTLLQLLQTMNQKPEEYTELSVIMQSPVFSGIASTVIQIITNALQRSKPVRSDIAYAISYIRDHFTEDLSLEKLAVISNMSKNHFSSLFKKETHYSFVEYVNRQRIEYAKQLLMNSTLRTYEIADQIGISDYRYFCRLFNRYTGKQPGDYRHNFVDNKIVLMEDDKP